MNTLGVEKVIAYKIVAHGTIEDEDIEIGFALSPTIEGQDSASVFLKKMRKDLKNAEQIAIVILEINQSDRGISCDTVSKFSLVSHKVVGDKKSDYSIMYTDINNQNFVEDKIKLKKAFNLIEREVVSAIGRIRLLNDIFGIGTNKFL